MGLDCSITKCGLASPKQALYLDWDTRLRLNSDLIDYVNFAGRLADVLNQLPGAYILAVDFTMFSMRARQSQMRLNALLIGLIVGGINELVDVKLVEPSNVRKALGLPARAQKTETWGAFDNQYPHLRIFEQTSEHVRDALILSSLAEQGRV